MPGYYRRSSASIGGVVVCMAVLGSPKSLGVMELAITRRELPD